MRRALTNGLPELVEVLLQAGATAEPNFGSEERHRVQARGENKRIENQKGRGKRNLLIVEKSEKPLTERWAFMRFIRRRLTGLFSFFFLSFSVHSCSSNRGMASLRLLRIDVVTG